MPDPMNRPRMPKNAPLDTVMLVPVRGPMIAVGSTASVPTAVPTAIEVTVCQKLQAEQDGERAEHDVRPGQVRAEEHRAQVARPGVAGVLGEVLDAGGLDGADAVVGQGDFAAGEQGGGHGCLAC